MSKLLDHHDIFYFRIPLDTVPFEELPVPITERYAYGRFYHVASVLNEPSIFHMFGVYDFLTVEPIKDIHLFKDKDLLLGEVISCEPPLRGRHKWPLLGQEPINIVKADLPHLKFGGKDKKTAFYLKEGNYYTFSGIETEYENVKHLQEPDFNGETNIIIKIAIELIRRKLKELGQSISKQEFENIAFSIFRNRFDSSKINDTDIWHYIKHVIPEILEIPIYSEVPKAVRRKALNEVNGLERD